MSTLKKRPHNTFKTRRNKLVVAIAATLLCLSLVAGISASLMRPKSGNDFRANVVNPPLPPPSPSPTLAKEYIYAGDRLIATEEPANQLPSVSITGPASNTVFSAPANITLDAIANDSDGTITQVQFFQGNTLLGTDTSSPYSFPWNAVTANTYAVTAKATDNNGAVTASNPITVIVNALPSVSVTSPATNTVFNAPADITINVTATDSDGTISRVEFFKDNVLINTDTTSPYSYVWPGVSAGTYSITAKATDNNNGVTTSSAITVVVNALPSVSITNPANNTNFTAPANITINANATDADGTISRVEFYQGSTLLNTDTSVPYSYPWNGVTQGNYQLTAKAFDNRNAFATSSIINVTVGPNAPPVATITSPASGTLFNTPASITINATATDSDGSVTKVDFYEGNNLLGTDTSFPYSFVWNTSNSGTYQLTARATDNGNAVGTSPVVSVTVNVRPTVVITSPTANAVFNTPASIAIVASASDPDGSVNRVEFYQGTTLLNTDTVAPYSFTWNPTSAGTYSLTAKVTDNNNVTVASNPVNVIVNIPPTVSITNPGNNDVFTAPATITLDASASDADGTITRVEFYQGTTLLNTDTAPPYSYTWPNVVAGTYSITAKATDNNNTTITSSAVTVISNVAPTVSITSPANNAIFSPPANITISASAADSDGTISSVEFYQGSTLIDTDTAPPFTVSWNGVVAGSYQLTAKATDNRGAVTTSAVVAVTTPTFYDDFNDNSLDLGKWNIRAPGSSPTITEQSQQLRLTLTPSTAGYNGVGTNATFDMRGGTAQVEMVQPVSLAGWVENFFNIELDAQNYFMFQIGVGNMIMRYTLNGVNDQLLIPYDNVAHRFWRLRHNLNTGTASFETSPDGTVWTSRKTVTVGFSVTALKFVLMAGAYGTGNASPGAAIYNDFQYIPDPSLQGTPLPIFFDDFNDNSLNTAKWDPNNLFSGFTSMSVPVNETGQRFEIGPLLQNTGGSNYRGIRSVNTYNHTGAYSYVELAQAPDSSTAADAMFTVGKDVDNYYRIYYSAGFLFGQKKIAATKTTLFQIPYDSVNHRFLRIRHDSGTGAVTLDTAPSTQAGGAPGAWTQRYSETWNTAVTLTAIIFEMKGGTSQAEVNAPGKAIFDNFAFGLNSAPPVNAPTVTAISPNTGVTTGGTSVTITGTGFAAGASVSLGGAAATSVSVVSSTSITATTSAHSAGAVDVVVTNTDSQSGTLTNGYTYTTPPSETVLLADNFNDNSIDTAKWDPNNLFSGFTSTSVPVNETGLQLEVGPLLQNSGGSNYRGIRSVNTYNFTGAYCYVELTQTPSSSTAADAMFTIGPNVDNYYRIYYSAGNLIGQRKIGGVKTTLFTIPYDSTNHRFLRIRHLSGSVTLDTAPGSGGAPGAWTQRYSEIWSSSVTLSSTIFEVKGGTSQAEGNVPGKAIFDNFKAAVPN